MKALICSELGALDGLRPGDIDEPTLAPGKVLVEVRAAAVNFPDVLMVKGLYQYKPPLPFVPGCELAGVVKAVGEGVSHVKPGDAVIAIVAHGAFAEVALADAARVLPLGPPPDFEAAAAFMFTYGTSYHALKDRAALAQGETVLVLGAGGGVGLAAVDLAKTMGARVIAAASSPQKLEACRARGADEAIDYSREDLRERVKALTGGRGVDVVYDPVGGALSEPALRSMAWRGRFLVVGFAAGEIPKIPLNLALMKGCDIVGVFWGTWTQKNPAAFAASIDDLLKLYAEGKIKPHVSAHFPLAKGANAIAHLGGRHAMGKVVITID
jgi:NADPH2:quinone reductase